jgi:phosphomannomutase
MCSLDILNVPAMKWIKSKDPKIASTGWATYSSIVAIRPDDDLDLSEIESLLTLVSEKVHQADGRVAYTMNGCVISIGSYVQPLLKKAKEIAKKIETQGEREEFALVTSYQTLRSKSVRDSIETLGPINLTIIDEAHHFRNPNTQTHEVAECLREISDSLIMLSATPVQLGDQNLHTLLKLIAPDLIGDYASFRAQFSANRGVLEAGRTIASGIDGVRVVWADGFGLIRASNTTPVLVLRFEGQTPAALARIQGDMMALLTAVKPDAAVTESAH